MGKNHLHVYNLIQDIMPIYKMKCTFSLPFFWRSNNKGISIDVTNIWRVKIVLFWTAIVCIGTFTEVLPHLSDYWSLCLLVTDHCINAWLQCYLLACHWTVYHEDVGPTLYKCYTNVLCLLGKSFDINMLLCYFVTDHYTPMWFLFH